MGHSQNLVDLVDARIRAGRDVTRTTGTYLGLDDGGIYALVAFDGDPLPMPVKWAAGMGWLIPETRVGLDRYGSDWYITTGLSNKDYWAGRRSSDTTLISNFTVTSGTVGTPQVGFDFIAPLTGSVWVAISGSLWQNTAGNTAYLGYQLRTGTDYPTGVTVNAFSSVRAILAGTPANTGSGTFRYYTTGLVPGAPYVIRAGYWTSPAGSGTVNSRYLAVEPVG